MGRLEELQTLGEKLQTADPVAITALAGMGGVGKTALAQQYVREAKAQYPGGRWYFKLREQSLATQIVTAATVFGWQLPDGMTEDAQRVQWCYDQWCRHFPGTRLLLLDDVQQYGDVKPFLPFDESSLRVLMTSRQRFGPPVNRLDLDVLPLPEALVLFTQLMGDTERVAAQQAEAEALCEWVGRLPLGVELIARYLATHPSTSLAKLQERLEAKRLEARALRTVPTEMAYEYSIQAAFDLSWQDLPAEGKTMMGLLASFAAAPIPMGLIAAASPDWDEEDREEALDTVLVQRNLVQRDSDGSYQLHQLVREFTRMQLATELQAATSTLQKAVADALVNLAQQIPQIVTVSAQQQVSAAMPHLALVARTLTPLLANSTDALWPFVGLARFYQSQSLWPEAEYWYQACLTTSEQRFGPDYPATAGSLNNLALLYESMGRYGEAEPLYARAIEIYEAQLGPDHPETAMSLNNLALLYESMGRYSEAETLYVRAIEIYEAQLGPDHPDTATSLNNLAGLYKLMGRYVEAEPLYARSSAIYEAQLGPDHPDTATSLNNLAELYYSMGRYVEAEPLYARSLAIREAQLGPDYPDTATSLNNLALLYESMGRYIEAEPLYARSLEIKEAQLGPDHPDTATSLNNLAGLYESMGRYVEAEPLYARSLAIREAQLGPDHPSIATSLNNLAALYRAMGRYSEAKLLYARSLAIREAQLGPDHPDTAISLNNLALLYESMGRYSEAEPLYARSLEIKEAQLDPDHPDTAASFNNMGMFYYGLERYAEAANLSVKALAICLAKLGQNHPDTQTIRNNFVAILSKVMEANQTEQLAEHPLTQALLQALQSS